MSILVALTLFLALAQGGQSLGEVAGFSLTALLVALVSALLLLGELRLHPPRARGDSPAVGTPFPLLALPMAGVVSWLINGASDALMQYFYYAAFGMIAYLAIQRWPRAVVGAATWAAAFHIVVAMVEVGRNQSLFYGDWKTEAAQRTGGYLRAASTTADPNYLALTLVLLAPFLWTSLKGRSPATRRIAALGLFVALALTFSRGLIVAALVLLAASWASLRWRRATVRFVVTVGLGAILTVVVKPDLAAAFRSRIASLISGDVDASVSSRSQTQRFAFDLFLDSPAVGHGIGQSAVKLESFARSLVPLDVRGQLAFLPQTSVLNTYLWVAVEMGIFGLGVFVLVLARTYNSTRKTATVFRMSFLASLVVMLFLDAIFFAPFWFFIGAVSGWRAKEPLPEGTETAEAEGVGP